MNTLMLVGIVAAGLVPLSAAASDDRAAALPKGSRAPAADVLDALAHQNGMTIVYVDMDRPQKLVSVPTDTSTSVAVVDVLKQLGVGYALKTRKAGGEIATLILVGSAAPPAKGRAQPDDGAQVNQPSPLRPDATPVSARRTQQSSR
jgi:hypothetical protein